MLEHLKKIRWTTWLALFTALSFVAILTLNHFREPWFDVIEGYAPYNFAWNMGFVLPSIAVILFTGLWSMVSTLLAWKRWTQWYERYPPLLISLPIVLFILQRTLMILRMG